MIRSYVLTSTLRDMLKPMRILPWVLLAAVLAGVSLLWASMAGEDLGARQYGILVRMIVYRIVPLAAAMFTMAVVSQEIEQKTIVYMVTRTIPRNVMVFSRGLAAVVSVAVMSSLSLVAVAFVMLGPGFVSSPMFWMDLLIMTVGGAAYCALFIFVTLIMNRAMILILFYAFLWEAFVPYIEGDLQVFSVHYYMEIVATHPDKSALGIMSQMLGSGTPMSATVAWIVLGAVAVGVLWLDGWWFSRYQYLPREDAE